MANPRETLGPIPADRIATAIPRLRSIGFLGAEDGAYWTESRPWEGGRTVFVRKTASTQDEPLPEWTDLRSRVHEYGGGAELVVSDESGDRLFFSQASDNRVYSCRLPVQGTAENLVAISSVGPWRFADFSYDSQRRGLWCVVEDHSGGGRAKNIISFLPESGGSPSVFAEGGTFYSNPRLSPDGSRLAYLRWDDPLLPWEGTALYVADLDRDGRPKQTRRIAGSSTESVLDPRWAADGSLVFLSDRAGFWNPYRSDLESLLPPMPLASERAEWGLPPWIFGRGHYGFFSDGTLVGAPIREGFARFQVATGETFSGSSEWTWCESLRVRGDRVIGLFSAPHRAPSVLSWKRGELSAARLTSTFDEDEFAPRVAFRAFSFATRDGETAHGFLYTPSRRRGPNALIIDVHGGPTAQAEPQLDATTAFWTTRGFAVASINFRGSTGFGRTYRDRLRGAWGRVDVTDCADAAQHLIDTGEADPKKIAIRGGSSGGFTALVAAATEPVFRAATSRYGVTDPKAIGDDTHKFEARYNDFLLGAEISPEELALRSPIELVDRIACPVLLLQGEEDRVVPPAQSRMLYGRLRARRAYAELIEYPGEGHGFRQQGTIRAALEAEYDFYRSVFSL